MLRPRLLNLILIRLAWKSTGKTFCRPMNRAVHTHIKSIMPADPAPDEPVFLGGGSRPNARFQELCELAGIKPKKDVQTGEEGPWMLKDLRKTCATYYDEHVPESSIEILGHSGDEHHRVEHLVHQQRENEVHPDADPRGPEPPRQR